jgi:predicted GIY-YIG superfamily endonuclease
VREEYHDKMTAVLHGDRERRVGEHCEGDPHRWHHKALDCSLEEGRLQKHQERERRKLTELQRLRKLRLLEDAEANWALSAAEEDVAGEVSVAETSASEATDSGDGAIRNSHDRKVIPPRPKSLPMASPKASPAPGGGREAYGVLQQRG